MAAFKFFFNLFPTQFPYASQQTYSIIGTPLIKNNMFPTPAIHAFQQLSLQCPFHSSPSLLESVAQDFSKMPITRPLLSYKHLKLLKGK